MAKNYLKTDIWKKAYLIEFVENGEILDAFTFSVPPESEELTYSQRKSETKTFGGLHVDDYGLDAVKITLSGSTINQDLKRIYNPIRKGHDEWKTGEQEIYYLRDLIKKYKTGENLTKDITIMLYDLSKIDYISGTTIKNYWRVFPGDFKIRRASDKPFTYKYSMEFTAVDYEDEKNKNDLLAPKLGWAQTALEKIRGSVAALERGLDRINEGKALLDDFNSSIRDITAILDAYTNILTGYIDGITGILDSVNDIINIPGDLSTKGLNIGLEFMNSGKKLLKSVENITNTIRAYGTSEYWAPEEVLDEYNMTAAEYADTWDVICNGLEDEANTIVAVSKTNDLPDVTVVSPETETNAGGDSTNEGGSNATGGRNKRPGRYTVVFSYGDIELTLKSTDTLESLAMQYCGSPDKAIDIATYNGIASLNDLQPGDTIKIPILEVSERNSYNRIYSRREDRNNYGRDILLDNEGSTVPSVTGDYELTQGTNNLSQAILLRLKESVRKRIRLNSYGIRTNISDPTAGVVYILSSIDLTVSGDPRIRSVDNIQFQGHGDDLNVTVFYRDINHANGSAAGRV